jgi:hypothetical protein
MTFDDFEDDEQEFERPARKNKGENISKPATRHDDDEDDRPVRRQRPSVPAVSDDDDETPKRRVVRSGWAGVEQTKVADSDYASRLKITDDPQIIKFIEDEPFASWRQHWLERSGQKSFTCLGDNCPLCNAGNKPTSRFAFNVALLSEGEDAVLKSFEIGVRVIGQLQNFHKEPRTGPLSKHYWAVSKTGKGASTVTNLQLVKERDLEEYGLEAISHDAFDELVSSKYTDEIIAIPKRSELLRIAEEELDA